MGDGGRRHWRRRGTKVRRLREDERALGEICQEDGREYKEWGVKNKNTPGMSQRYPTLWALIYSFNLKNILLFCFPGPSSSLLLHITADSVSSLLWPRCTNRQLRTIDHHAVFSPQKQPASITNLLIPYIKFWTMPQKLDLQITIPGPSS